MPRVKIQNRLGLLTPVYPSGLKSHWVAFDRAGAPNSALQCYRPGNVTVKDSNLILTAQVETCTCASFDLASASYSYSSGYVAMNGFNFQYGEIEARIKFGGAQSSGCWPVFWMENANCQASDPTGTDDTCTGEEIDIAEILSSDYTLINQQMHVGAHNDQNLQSGISDPAGTYHVYRLEWSAGQMIWKIDGATTFTVTQAYIPALPMYAKFMYNVGYQNGAVVNGSLSWQMMIDYVTVTQSGVTVFGDDFT
jgi:beta-glucanase (GH16 family)